MQNVDEERQAKLYNNSEWDKLKLRPSIYN